MNLRVYKKDIEYFVGEFIDDCLLFAAINPNKGFEEIDQLIDEARDLYNDLKDKGCKYPKAKLERKARLDAKAKRAQAKEIEGYFNGLRNEMFAAIDSLCEKLSTIVSKAE